MKARLAFALLLFLLPLQGWGASFIERAEGVYKHRFMNGLVSGEEFESEDVMEIVRISETAAYIRYALSFYNGHVCSLSGVAEEKDGRLLYRDALSAETDEGCMLEISAKDGNIITDDTSDYNSDKYGCRAYCGARGSFEGVAFPTKARRPIRYMKRLKNSQEYKTALKNYDSRRAAPKK